MPTKTELTAVDRASLFMHHVICLHGCVDDIVSDQDPRFTSKFFSEFCRLTGTKQSLSTAYHPESDASDSRKARSRGSAMFLKIC